MLAKLNGLLYLVMESIPEGIINQFALAQKVKAEVFCSILEHVLYLMATDVKFPDFDPQTSSFSYLSDLRRKAHALGERSGITMEQLKAICIQCSHCKRLLSRITHQYHECPVKESLEESDDGDFFKSPEYRLDAVGEGAALHGLDQETFENMFFQCVDCERVVTTAGRTYHVCPFLLEYE